MSLSTPLPRHLRRRTHHSSADTRPVLTGYFKDSHAPERSCASKWKHRPIWATSALTQAADLNGGQGRNRTTDTRIFRPLSRALGAYNQTLAALASPLPSHTKAHSWHTQSELDTFLAQSFAERS